MWSTQDKQGPKGVNSLSSGYSRFALLSVMDTATSLPQNLYFSLFYMPHTTHTQYLLMFTRVIVTEGRDANSPRQQVETVASLRQAGIAGSSAQVSGCFYRQTQLQNMEPNKMSISLWNTSWEDKICNDTLCKINVVDHSRRNLHHLLQ